MIDQIGVETIVEEPQTCCPWTHWRCSKAVRCPGTFLGLRRAAEVKINLELLEAMFA